MPLKSGRCDCLLPNRLAHPKTLRRLLAEMPFHVARVTTCTAQRLYSMPRGKELQEDIDERSAFEIAASMHKGTDIKPLECLLFLRDVRSRVYFEQKKSRGTRVLTPTDLQAVSGAEARVKTHFVIVDAVGVCESDKNDSSQDAKDE